MLRRIPAEPNVAPATPRQRSLAGPLLMLVIWSSAFTWMILS